MSSRLHPEVRNPLRINDLKIMPEKLNFQDTALLVEPETSKSSSRRSSESQNADFMLIKIVARICINLIRRFVSYYIFLVDNHLLWQVLGFFSGSSPCNSV